MRDEDDGLFAMAGPGVLVDPSRPSFDLIERDDEPVAV